MNVVPIRQLYLRLSIGFTLVKALVVRMISDLRWMIQVYAGHSMHGLSGESHQEEELSLAISNDSVI